jgi:ribose-phosphate pyrophosphokinase
MTPVSDNLMKLLLTIDAARRGGAAHILAVIPYFGYARQDRRIDGRSAISAKLVAHMIEEAGADSVYTIDIHSEQTLGFFNKTVVDNEWALPVLMDHIPKEIEVIISPDTGGVRRARKLAESMNKELAILDKRRPFANTAEILNVIGDVSGKHCLIVDDIIDTGGTMIKAAELLKRDHQVASLHIAATHGVFSRFNELALCPHIDTIYVTDTLSSVREKSARFNTGIKVASVEGMIRNHIRKVDACLR